MKRIVACTALTVAACMGQDSESTWSLQKALQKANEQTTPEAADVAVAKARLAWVEAARARKIEITPSTALWSVVNPLSLATSLGASMLGPAQAVSPVTVLEAKIDLAFAEAVAQRRKFERETQVVEQYMALSVLQDASARQCQAQAVAQQHREQTQKELSKSRVTQLDVLAREQEILDRQADCHRSDRDRQMAANTLAATLHLDGDDLQVQDPRKQDGARPLLSAGELYSLAVAYRSDATSTDRMKKQVKELAELLETVHDNQLRLVIKDNGAFEAERHLAAESLRRLDILTADFEQQVRARITDLRLRAESYRDQLKLAEHRVSLLAEQQLAVANRLKAGLATRSDVLQAEEAHRSAAMLVADLRNQTSANADALLSACGLTDRPAPLQAQIYVRYDINAAVR